MRRFFRYKVFPLIVAFSVGISTLVTPVNATFGEFVDHLMQECWDVLENFTVQHMIEDVKILFAGESDEPVAGGCFYRFELIGNPDNLYYTTKEYLEQMANDLILSDNKALNYVTPVVTTITVGDGDSAEKVYVLEAYPNFEAGFRPVTRVFIGYNNQIFCAPYDEIGDDNAHEKGKWVKYRTQPQQQIVSMRFLDLAQAYQEIQGYDCKVEQLECGYVLSHTTGSPPYYEKYVYASPSGNMYVAPSDNRVVNGDRDHLGGDVNIDQETGDIIINGDESIDVGIDIDGGTLNLPDGAELEINQVIYDDSTKTYYVDAWGTDKEGDTYVTYNYSFTYNIDYTSITYIGQTEEYNKYYKVYYELPDGRSSADLTAEELEQLNVSMDVLPYVRSTDDVHVRALYHFDGDTRDSSYWNHLSSFEWTTGASITYMDAGVFDGALYLDEQAHRFVITLPKNIASSDFTIQWRMYQSATPAPVNDTTFGIAGVNLLTTDGSNWCDNTASNAVIAPIPVGTWNEYAIVRGSDGLHFFINGVKVHSWNAAYAIKSYTNKLIFNFGSDQQTYKYFDELRVVTKALYSTSGYTPTSVPHDTNLALVLPDSKLPVADAYWTFEGSGTNLLENYNLSEWVGVADADKSNLVTQSITTNGYFGVYYNSSNYQQLQYSVTPYLKTFSEGSTSWTTRNFPHFTYGTNTTKFTSGENGSKLSVAPMKTSYDYISPNYSVFHATSRSFVYNGTGFDVTGGMFTTFPMWESESTFPKTLEGGKTYTLSMVDDEGNIGSFTFTMPETVSHTISGGAYDVILPESLTPITESKYLQLTSAKGSDTHYRYSGYEDFAFVGEYLFNDYYFIVYPSFGEGNGNYDLSDYYMPEWVLQIVPVVSDETLNSETGYYDGGDFVYLELVEGESDLKAEYVEGIAVMDKDDLHTPSLAVKTDLEITGHQIGGIRPSVPEKGLVWALVEGGVIKSLQIYNGSAWEAVDGRIWTGSRWVPYSAYNVLLLKDLYDITGTVTPDDYEYIYTETGFWSWLQKWLNDFKAALFGKLDQIIDGSGSADPDDDTVADCEHAYAIDFQSDPTCTDPGKTVYSCPMCGDTYTEYVDALDHDWVEQTHVDDSYHLPTGVSCPNCSGTNFLPTLSGDVYSCTCSDCQTTWEEDAVKVTGYTLYECSRCGEQRKEHNDADSNLFEAIGNFLADGVEWISDKLQQLVKSLSGITDIFTGMAETIKQYAGDFSGLFGEFLALMPADLMNVVWFGLVIMVVLMVWKKWFS